MKNTLIILIIASSTFLTSCKEAIKNTNDLLEVNKDLPSVTDKNYNLIDGNAVKGLIKTEKDLSILDVRTPEEVIHGSIPNAMMLNFYDNNFKERIAALDKNKTYLVYCQSGIRSKKASNMMVDLGFNKIYELKGGYLAYK